MHENGPPSFPGVRVGQGLDELPGLATPWTVSRAITAPDLTRRLLAGEPGWAGLPTRKIDTISGILTFLFQQTKTWTLVWAESVAGPARFGSVRTVRSGAGIEEARELARTAGMKVGAEGDVWVAAASAELSSEWTKLTNSKVRIDNEAESTRVLQFDVPPGGMDIALWQLEVRLTRRLVLRPGARLPEPLPDWVEIAIASPVRSVRIPTDITRSLTRTVDDQPQPGTGFAPLG